jgi:hypothetical protein
MPKGEIVKAADYIRNLLIEIVARCGMERDVNGA